MPCESEYLRRDSREEESCRVREFLKEISGQPFDHQRAEKDSGDYGNVRTLDADTAHLCKWCKGNENHLSGMSLELQLWWARHQQADRIREEREAIERAERELAAVAEGKLTPAERKALCKKVRRG